jgi:hypothetical protein
LRFPEKGRKSSKAGFCEAVLTFGVVEVMEPHQSAFFPLFLCPGQTQLSTLGQLNTFLKAIISHLTFPPAAPSTHNSLLLILNATSRRTAKSKRWSAVVQNPFPPSERSLPIEFQIRRRQPWLLSLSSAPPDPLPPPLRETLSFTPSRAQTLR